LAEVLLLLRLLLLGELLLHEGALLDFLARVAVGGEEGLGELGELVVDADVLEAAAVGGEPLV